MTTTEMKSYYTRDGCFLWNNKYWEGLACSPPVATDCGCNQCTKCSKSGFNTTLANGDRLWWSLNALTDDVIKMQYDPTLCGN